MSKLTDKRKTVLEAMMKEAIYEATEHILIHYGLEGLTMDRVAEAAEIAKGTLYNYFKDKDALLTYVYAKIAEPFIRESLEVRKSHTPPEKKLRAMAESMFRGLEHHRNVLITLTEGRIRNLRNYHDKLVDQPEFSDAEVIKWPLEKTIEAIIEEGIDANVFRSLNPEVVSSMFIGAVISIIETEMEQDRFRPVEQNVNYVMDLFLEGLKQPL